MTISCQTNPVTIVDHNPLLDFRSIASQPGAVWLDSSLSFADRGAFSFIARRPVLDISQQGPDIVVTNNITRKTVRHNADIFEVLESYWADPSLFSVGYIGYEACLRFVGLETPLIHSDIPPVRFLFYDRVNQYPRDRFTSAANKGTVAANRQAGQIIRTMSREKYCRQVKRIKEHIREGDIYQANFTTRIDLEYAADPFTVYERLRNLNPAPYSAYLNFGDYQILSSSPERMFLKDNSAITSGPIKGTIARTDNPGEDTQRLLASDKDRAELLMIVDLVRNDLGKIAQTGSVRVDNIFKPEVYSSLIHLVGDIAATISRKTKITDIIAALLPGGSITGAPKQRAVKIISELEATPRSVYTGCIGYVHGDRADFNIAIRTMTHRDGVYQIHAGGGIVADSDPEAEYDEMFLKADNLLKALGTEFKEAACSKP